MNIREKLPLIIFNAVYLSVFSAGFFSRGNYEFILYAGVCSLLFLWVLMTEKKHQFSLFLLWALSFWGFLHMAGGAVRLQGGVLYNHVLFPLFAREDVTVLRYDHFVHAYGFGVMTWASYQLMKPQLKSGYSRGILALAVFAGMGFGALNEVLEFGAVLFMKQTGVGGYYNTAFDLLFNMIGTLIAASLLAAFGDKK